MDLRDVMRARYLEEAAIKSAEIELVKQDNMEILRLALDWMEKHIPEWVTTNWVKYYSFNLVNDAMEGKTKLRSIIVPLVVFGIDVPWRIELDFIKLIRYPFNKAGDDTGDEVAPSSIVVRSVWLKQPGGVTSRCEYLEGGASLSAAWTTGQLGDLVYKAYIESLGGDNNDSASI